MMKIHFVCSDKIGSRIIRSVTREDVSHVAVETTEGLIIHATPSGVQIDWWRKFYNEHVVVTTLDCSSLLRDTDSLLDRLMEKQGTPYDWAALLWLGVRALVQRKLGISLPGPNQWANRRAFECVEYVSWAIWDEQDSMLTPGQLRDKLILNGAKLV